MKGFLCNSFFKIKKINHITRKDRPMNILLKKQFATILLMSAFSINNQLNAFAMIMPLKACGCTQQPQPVLPQPQPEVVNTVTEDKCGCNKPRPVAVMPTSQSEEVKIVVEDKCGCNRPKPVAVVPILQSEEVKNTAEDKCGCNKPKPAVVIPQPVLPQADNLKNKCGCNKPKPVTPVSITQPQPALSLNQEAKRNARLMRCYSVLADYIKKLPCDSELKEMIMEIMHEQELDMLEAKATRPEKEPFMVGPGVGDLNEIKALLVHCCSQQQNNFEQILTLLQTIIVIVGQCCPV